ncbi:MAG: hypothetical protein M0Z66_11350 [Thermaerobacter sp.]|nr:hypothetical protein [Thermaerobacter sp.]
MTRVVLLRSTPDDRLPDWATPQLSVRIVRTPLEVPFAVLREPADIVVTDTVLPPEVGAIELPVLLSQSLPADPSIARGMLQRIASAASAASEPLGRLAPRLPALIAEAQQVHIGLAGLNARPAPEQESHVVEAETAAASDVAPPSPEEDRQEETARALPGRTPTQSITVVVDPVLRLTDIEELIDLLEAAPGLHIRFRLYRDGVYRIDGMAEDRHALLAWLLTLPFVAHATLDAERIEIRPSGSQ